MRVSFDSTLDEVVDLVVRSQHGSGTYRILNWSAAGLAGLVVMVATVGRATASGPVRAAVAVLAGIVAGLMYHEMSSRINRGFVRRRVRRRFRSLSTLHSDVEIQDAGVLFEEASLNVLIKWSEIARAKITGEGIELWGGEGLLAIVRSRAFADADHQQSFADEVNRRARG